MFACLNLSVVFKNTFFCSMKPRFLLYMNLSGVINYMTFSVVPSIIIENAIKRVVPMEQRTLLSSNESLKRAALKSTQNKNTRPKK
jgi:hypothetical protein